MTKRLSYNYSGTESAPSYGGYEMRMGWISTVRSLVVLLLICFFLAHVQTARAHQPHDAVSAIAVSPAYKVDRTVFVTTDQTSVTIGAHLVLKSTDGGVTWNVPSGLPNYRTSRLVISPAFDQDGTAFAATIGGGLYSTTDAGESWIPVGHRIGKFVLDVVLSPSFKHDGTAFAINGTNRLFKSTNGGVSWGEIPAPAATNLSELAISPNYNNDQTLLLGSYGTGIFKSTDGGSSWADISQGLSNLQITDLAFSPLFSSDERIFAATFGGGVHRSYNGGVTWVPQNLGISDLETTEIELSPRFAQDSTIFVASATGGVHRSTNAAVTWSKTAKVSERILDVNQTSLHYRALGLALTGQGNVEVFLGMFESLWRSNDLGASWRYVEILPTHLVRSMKISPDYRNDRTLLATTYGGGLVASFDGGKSWTHKNTRLSNSYPDALAFSPNYASDRTVFCGTVWGLQKAVGAAPWKMMTMLGQPSFVRAISISPTFDTDGAIFVGTFNFQTLNPQFINFRGRLISSDGVFVFVDGTDTAIPTTLNGPNIQSVQISPQFQSDRTIFAASVSTGLYKSTNAGASWQFLPLGNIGVFGIELSPSFIDDQTLFVSSLNGGIFNNAGVFKSEDGGGSWSKIPVPGSESVTVLDVAVSPNYTVDQTLFIATLQQGLFISTDGGSSMLRTTLSENYVTSITVSPDFAIDHTLFAATYRGIFRSADAGSTWSYVSTVTRHEESAVGASSGNQWRKVTVPMASSSQIVSSAVPLATFDFNFVGSGVRWIGGKGPRHGIAVVLLDGAPQALIDLYDPSVLLQQTLWEKTGLSDGEHSLTIRVTGTQNPLSIGKAVTIDAFDIWLATP